MQDALYQPLWIEITELLRSVKTHTDTVWESMKTQKQCGKA